MIVRRSPLVVPFLLLACGPSTPAVTSAPPPAASTSVAAPPPSASASTAVVAPPPICLPKEVAAQPLAHVSVAGGEATLCYATSETAEAGKTYPCVTIDAKATRVLGRGSWKATEPPKRAPAVEPAFTVTSTAKEVEVCKTGSKTCSKIKLGYRAPRVAHGYGKGETEGVPAAVNADGTKVFVIDGEIPQGKNPNLTTSLVVFGDTFDVKTGKRLSHVDLTADPEKMNHVLYDQSDTWSLEWMGERVLVGGYRCCGPAGAKELLDPKTGATVILGDPQFFFQVDGDVWLVGRDRAVDQLELVDVVAGKSLVKMTLPSNTPEPGPELYGLDAKRLEDGKVLVSFTNPPGATVVDVKKRAISTPLVVGICQ